MPKLEKSLLVMKVTTHPDGVEGLPRDTTGAGERTAGQLLLTVCGTFVAAGELPEVDPRLRPMNIEVLGWDGRRISPAGNAAPLSPEDSMNLLVGLAGTLGASLDPRDAHAGLIARFIQGYYAAVAEMLEVDGVPLPEVLDRADDDEQVH